MNIIFFQTLGNQNARELYVFFLISVTVYKYDQTICLGYLQNVRYFEYQKHIRSGSIKRKRLTVFSYRFLFQFIQQTHFRDIDYESHRKQKINGDGFFAQGNTSLSVFRFPCIIIIVVLSNQHLFIDNLTLIYLICKCLFENKMLIKFSTLFH